MAKMVVNINGALDRIKANAHERGFEMIATQASHVYQLESTYYVANNKLIVMTHIPMVSSCTCLFQN